MKFGANCYGIKPVGTMSLIPTPNIPGLDGLLPPPLPPQKMFCDKDKNFNACNKLTDDKIKPFNNAKWSRY